MEAHYRATLVPAGYLLGWLLVLSLLVGCSSVRSVHVHNGPTLAAVSTDTALPTSLRVATFNVWGLPRLLNGASASRFRRIAAGLEELGPDVVLMQEVWTRRCFKDLSGFAKGTNKWCTADARRGFGLIGQNGLLTLSRYPIEGACFKAFGESRFPDSVVSKGALKITVSICGRRVNIWNVHMQDGAEDIRSRQISELLGWVAAADDGQVADIVGGDFNVTPGSDSFRRIVAEVGPSVLQLSRGEVLPTWDGLSSSPSAGVTLDHVFIRTKPRFAVSGARQRRIFEAPRKDRLSDHMGIEAMLSLDLPDDAPRHDAKLAMSAKTTNP